MSGINKWLMGKNIRALFGAAAFIIALISFYMYNLVSQLFAFGFPIAAFILAYGIYLHYKLSRRALLNQLRKQWGNPLKTERNIKMIKDAYERLDLQDEGSYKLDDQTWNDLHMDDIFALTDHSLTSCGQVLLYNMLRKPIVRSSEWERRKKAIHALHIDVDFREKLQMILHNMGKQDKEKVEMLLTDELPLPPKFWILLEIVPYIGLMSLVSFNLFLSLGKIELTILPTTLIVFLSLINGIVRYRLKSGILSYFSSMGYLSSIIYAARAVKSLSANGLEEQLNRLSKAYEACKVISHKTSALRIEQVDPFGLYTYINVLFLIDIRMFFRAIRDIRKYRSELINLYAAIGELDALASIASFRDGYTSISEPELHSTGKKLEVYDIVHPLVDNAVANSISLNEKGALITGSNMSGKSTFLRAIAVNAVLAQSICATFSSKYIGTFTRVISSISQSDNLLGGKSYYLAEAETLLNMLNQIQSGIPSLCIIDEIFRGTNSKERIAAASQLLKYMSGLNALTIVATHDIELTDIVKDEFNVYYFDEDVDNEGLVFDYHLRNGVSPTRNAIKILDYLGYPKEIVANSKAIIEKD